MCILDRVLSKEQVSELFRGQEPNWRAVERQREAWLYDVLRQPYAPRRDSAGRILESRALLDESSRWAAPGQAEKVIERIARAGFNVYIPCVWHGRGACWPSKLTPMERGVEKIVREEQPGFDPGAPDSSRARPRKDVITGSGCYAEPRWNRLRLHRGWKPAGACEVHNPAFRKFAVDLMFEVVQRFVVDGINMDFIRTIGVSNSATAHACIGGNSREPGSET